MRQPRRATRPPKESNQPSRLPSTDQRSNPPRAMDEFRRTTKLFREHRRDLVAALKRMREQNGGELPTEALPIVTDMVVKMYGTATKAMGEETRARESLRKLRDEGLRMMEDSELMALLQRAAEQSGYVDAAQLRLDMRYRMRDTLVGVFGLPREQVDLAAERFVDRLFPPPVERDIDLRRVLKRRLDRDISGLEKEAAELHADPLGLPGDVIDEMGLPVLRATDGEDPDDL